MSAPAEDARRAEPAPAGDEVVAAGPAGGAEPRRRSWLRELPVLLGVALVLSLALKALVVQAFYIPSGSMERTLSVGDRVLVDKVSYRLRDVRRGEVIVFDGAGSFVPSSLAAGGSGALAGLQRLGGFGAGERDFIKRVIGLPGERVRCCDDAGRLTVDGVPLDEPYVHPDDTPSELTFDVVVPPGRLWVMGDHRSRSADSRVHLGDPGGGTVPLDRVIGRAVVVAWPLHHWRRLEPPAVSATAPAQSLP